MLTEYQGKLIAAGSFASMDSTPASNIAEWDGVGWSSLGSGSNNSVTSLTVYGGNLWAVDGRDLDAFYAAWEAGGC